MAAEPPFSVRRLDHVVLRCARFEQTLAFYQEVLGCPLERSVEHIGLYQLRAGEALIDLIPLGSELGGDAAPDISLRNLEHFCLRVELEDWSHVRNHLQQHDVEWMEPQRRYGADGFGMSVYIQGPEGNTVELKTGDDT